MSEKAGSPVRSASRAPWLAVAIGPVFAVVAAAVGLWAHACASHPPTLQAQLDSSLGGLAARGQLSGTILVANKRGPVFNQGYGYADRAARIRNGPNTKYADITITTNLSITELAYGIQVGAFQWGDRICAYLPSCPASWRPITIRTLLDGTSHLPDYYWGHPGNTARQSLVGCQGQPLDPPSLGQIEYQVCTNLVLALIVEKVDANPWGLDQMLQLAGMHNSAQLTDVIRSPERALDYVGSTPDPNATYNDFFIAYTTAEDEYSFDNALFGGHLLSRQYLNAILAPRLPVEPSSPGISNTRWGYYWQVGELFGHRVAFTYAEINRFMSVNMRFPDSGLTVIVLSNSSATDVRDVAIHAAALALGASPPAAPATSYVPRALLGTYQRVFTAADARKGYDPLDFAVGHRQLLTIGPGYVHYVVNGNSPTDEYYRATPDGRFKLLGYMPANQNNMCQVQPNITPPTGYFRWSLHGKVLTITTVNGNHCGDRAAFFAGRWTKTG